MRKLQASNGQRQPLGLATILLGLLVFTACSPTQPNEREMLPRIAEYSPSSQDWKRLESSKATFAEGYEIDDPPDFEVVAWIDPEDVPSVRTACIKALSTDVVATADGYQVTSPNDDQLRRDRLAEYQCFAQYPVREDIRRPPEGGEIREAYEHLRAEFIPCLEKAGFSGIKLPSFEVFQDSMKQSPGETYKGLYDQLAVLLPDAEQAVLAEAFSNCPLLPAGFRAYQR